MTNKEKAKLLKNRHLWIVIEWGGVKDMFSNMSNMSINGTAEFLEIMSLNDEKEINNRLTSLVLKEEKYD